MLFEEFMPVFVYLIMKENRRGGTMGDRIDVLIAFDTETIVKVYGPNQDPNSPRSVNPSLIYMIVRKSNALSGQANGNLNIKAQVDDVIRWCETSLSLSADSNAILYKYIPLYGRDLISEAVPCISDFEVPLPNPDDPLHPTMRKTKSYYWSSIVKKEGSVIYTFRFMILDRDENIVGYYYWDPYITIGPNEIID
jgi:hypothetical protein